MQHIHDLRRGERPLKWLFLGDSITHGALHTFGARDYTELFSERVRTESGRPLDIVLKTAINGNTSRDLLLNFEWRVAQFAPDVVFVMIGANDCNPQRGIGPDQFRAHLETLCERLIALPGCHAVLQTTPPPLFAAVPERTAHFAHYMDIVREVAAARALPLVDHQKQWQERIAEQPRRQFFWMSDAIHPNNWGHQAMAELLFQCCDLDVPNALSQRFFRP